MTTFRRGLLAIALLGIGLAAGLVAQPPAVVPPPMPKELASFSPVVKRVLPAVVSIEGKAKAAKPAAKDDTDAGFGSGVIIDPSGAVLTNNHVLQDADSVVVTLQDGRKFTSRDIRRDPKSDLAVVKLDAAGPLPFLEFADSDTAEVGDRVLAVGAPFGLTGSVTHGIVSGKSRTNLRLNPFEDWIQTDAAVNPGNSGGPLVNLEGQLLGINAAIKTKSGGFSGVGLAVAANLCKTVSTQLLKDGVVRRGYLGANVRDLDDALAAKFGVKRDGGAIVTQVQLNTPASRAGLTVGDLVATIAGQPVTGSRDVQRIVSGLPLGKAAEVRIVRGGKVMVASVVIEEQPEALGVAAAPAMPKPAAVPGGGLVPYQALGFAVGDLNPELTARLGYPKETTGALLIAVTRGGWAEHAGLRAGQVIVKVDETPITSAAGFRQAFGKSDREKGALLHILRASGEVEFAVLRGQ